MLKRNKVLVAFIVVAVLCMSIGFAAISDTLYVSGNMSLNVADEGPLDKEFEQKVYFTNAIAVASDKITVSAIGDDSEDEAGNNDKYSFTLDAKAFEKITDSVTLTVDIKNENTADASVTVNTITEGALADFISVTATIDNASTATVEANKTKTLTIVVTLDKIPQTASTSEISFNLTAKPAT